LGTFRNARPEDFKTLAAVTTVHPDCGGLINTDQFAHVLEYRRHKERKIHTADKVKAAREAVEFPADLGIDSQQDLATISRNCNGRGLIQTPFQL
jgi:hypothetical protein